MFRRVINKVEKVFIMSSLENIAKTKDSFIDRTDQGGTRPSLFHLSARSKKSRANAPDFFTMCRKVE